MILYRFLRRRLQIEEPIVDGGRVLAVERNHLGQNVEAERFGEGAASIAQDREAQVAVGACLMSHWLPPGLYALPALVWWIEVCGLSHSHWSST